MKRAQSHIEVIISFVIFIGFVVFFMIFLNPFVKTQEKINENIKDILINEISSNIGKMSVIGGSGGHSYSVPFGYPKHVDVITNQNGKLKCMIYFSNEVFLNNIQTCNFNTYEFGVYYDEDFAVYEKIEALVDEYNQNYDVLKERLGINKDFAIEFLYLNKTEIFNIENKVPGKNINIESENIPLRMINKEGNVNEIIFNLRKW